MRSNTFRVTAILALGFFFCSICHAQGNLHIDEPGTRMQLFARNTGVELALENAGRATMLARILLELVDPQGFVQSRANKEVSLPPGRTKINLTMPPAFAQNERADHENLLWYRLRYSIASVPAPGAAKPGKVRCPTPWFPRVGV